MTALTVELHYFQGMSSKFGALTSINSKLDELKISKSLRGGVCFLLFWGPNLTVLSTYSWKGSVDNKVLGIKPGRARALPLFSLAPFLEKHKGHTPQTHLIVYLKHSFMCLLFIQVFSSSLLSAAV